MHHARRKVPTYELAPTRRSALAQPTALTGVMTAAAVPPPLHRLGVGTSRDALALRLWWCRAPNRHLALAQLIALAGEVTLAAAAASARSRYKQIELSLICLLWRRRLSLACRARRPLATSITLITG